MMGFSKVYKALQDVFPEVDSRMLRAVAIEHSKDADMAVEVVLTEVIPYLAEKSRPSSSSGQNRTGADSYIEAAVDANGTSQTDAALSEKSSFTNVEQSGPSSSDAIDGHHECFQDANGETFYDADCGHNQAAENSGITELSLIRECDKSNGSGPSGNMLAQDTSLELIFVNEPDDISGKICKSTASDKTIQSMEVHEQSSPEAGSDQNNHPVPTNSNHEDKSENRSMSSSVHSDLGVHGGSSCQDVDGLSHEENDQDKSCAESNLLESRDHAGQNSLETAQSLPVHSPEGSVQSVPLPEKLNTCLDLSEANGFANAAYNDNFNNELLSFEDHSTLNTIVSRSGQICSIDLLEDIIADAKTNKKTLLCAMESVISLMREVELQEKAAEQAKEEASKGGFDILDRMEDLKRMLNHAKEANDMHAGEVYGEKAILATEVRELQSRLLSLSDERDKSLAILDEMRSTLHIRLETAETERKAAEQEKLEKEASAKKALAEQELNMEKVVREANILREEAEQNAKLREFLMDRGRIVDVLQGEISVICKDVRSLKENFDVRAPLSRSLSSRQTSCILASSSSSLRSMASEDQVPDQAESLERPVKTSMVPCLVQQHLSDGETASDDRKALADAGWEIFDAGDCKM